MPRSQGHGGGRDRPSRSGHCGSLHGQGIGPGGRVQILKAHWQALGPDSLAHIDHPEIQVVRPSHALGKVGGDHLDAPASLGEGIPTQILGLLREDTLHDLWCPGGVQLQEQGRRPRHMGSGHGGAAHGLVAATRDGGIDRYTRCREVRLDGQVGPTGPTGAEVRHHILIVRSPHGQGASRASGGAQGGVVASRVARGHHADDAGVHGGVHGLGNGIIGVARPPEAHVEDLGPVIRGRILVRIHGAIDAGDDGAVGPRAIGPEHLEGQELGSRRHAFERAVGRNDASHMGAVPIVVHGVPVPIDEVVAPDHLESRAETAPQVRVGVVDAGVDHRDSDALAIGSIVRPHLGRPDEGDAVGEGRLGGAVAEHPRHLGPLFQLLQGLGRNRGGQAVEGEAVLAEGTFAFARFKGLDPRFQLGLGVHQAVVVLPQLTDPLLGTEGRHASLPRQDRLIPQLDDHWNRPIDLDGGGLHQPLRRDHGGPDLARGSGHVRDGLEDCVRGSSLPATRRLRRKGCRRHKDEH